ncbi:4Fe-4S dicluster domain-containing protein [Cardinium endosymbiont of Culicoides punctatus]|uniref:4Fe-4S dicluster domain-containing protein n=1 Tax=Cardinium endosymbiont of Culicoides punctatus TaxID=2304601 RepID=UPI001058D33E|nr:4Fe-4S dicluster domain-containing protein [Cardinium endosymbiont of Culicoides punctatus]TDG95358.1 Ferredoxin [Cardinium endosymbiont of Culicoides punctatus]
MALRITDACINCGACEVECPNTAIYEGGMEWQWSKGTQLKTVELNGESFDATMPQAPYASDIFYIAKEKCTECVGFHEEPQCAAVCPVDCCVLDLDYPEDREKLLEKKIFLHGE